MIHNLWVFKTVEDNDRATQTVDNYNDELNSNYSYDSNINNHKQIKVGDNIILIDKKKILGFAQIEMINIKNGKKTIRRCPNPECRSTNIEPRKHLKPVYRCNKGHVFDEPKEAVKDVKQYTAYYSKTFSPIDTDDNNLYQLRPFYTKGYNRNNSIQLLANQALELFNATVRSSLSIGVLLPMEGRSIEYGQGYESNSIDERQIVYRQIKERRGQQKFRSELFNRHGTKCMITGCCIKDILEAAHINPYKGVNDNHLDNGLILRADIHTLFDLNLIGIEPETLIIRLNSRIISEYGILDGKLLACTLDNEPSKDALGVRWGIFNKNAKSNNMEF